jgi:hypothetical protein
VLLLAGEWNRAFLDEHETFPSGKFKDQRRRERRLHKGHGQIDLRHLARVGGMTRRCCVLGLHVSRLSFRQDGEMCRPSGRQCSSATSRQAAA